MVEGTICFFRNKQLAISDGTFLKNLNIPLAEYEEMKHPNPDYDIVFTIAPPILSNIDISDIQAVDDARGYKQYYDYFYDKFNKNQEWKQENDEYF